MQQSFNQEPGYHHEHGIDTHSHGIYNHSHQLKDGSYGAFIHEYRTFSHQGISCSLPVFTIQGISPGKHMLITAGIHGDEVNGIELAYRLLQKWGDDNIQEKILGTLTIVPVLNPLGFAKMQRTVPIDGQDLNRAFGVTGPERTWSHHYADYLFATLCVHADHSIDFHDAGSRVALMPHPRIHACESNSCSYCTREMSLWFGNELVLEREGDPRMMAVYANDHYGLPIMTIEVGGNQQLFEQYFADVVQGVEKTLLGLGYIQGSQPPIPTTKTYVAQREFYTHPTAGIISLTCTLGQSVQQGQRLAWHFDPISNTTTEIKAKNDGIVFSLWCAAQYIPDKHIVSIIPSSQSLQ